MCSWVEVEIWWSGMVSGATPDIWWQKWGSDGWSACLRLQPPDVCGYEWLDGWLRASRGPCPLQSFQHVLVPKQNHFQSLRLAEISWLSTYPPQWNITPCALWIVAWLLMFNLVGAFLKAPAFWPVLMELKAKSNWKKNTPAITLDAKFRLELLSCRFQSFST